MVNHLIESKELTLTELYKIHWHEGIQPANKIASLRKDFYQQLVHYLKRVKEESVKGPQQMKEYDTAMRLTYDIICCRCKKIVLLSSMPEGEIHCILSNLTEEELAIYKQPTELTHMPRRLFSLVGVA
jgi:DNA replication initiation complex subunit (GINS family)